MEKTKTLIEALTKNNAPGTGIYFSTEYDLFHFRPGDRSMDNPVDKKRITHLVKTFKKAYYGEEFPGLVSSDGTILDGRFRFAACKELNLPFHYNIKDTERDVEKMLVADLIAGVNAVVAGKDNYRPDEENSYSNKFIYPAMLHKELAKLGFKKNEDYDSNGWQMDWSETVTKDGTTYRVGGSGYYGGIIFALVD